MKLKDAMFVSRYHAHLALWSAIAAFREWFKHRSVDGICKHPTEYLRLDSQHRLHTLNNVLICDRCGAFLLQNRRKI